MKSSGKKIVWLAAALVILLLGVRAYMLFFKPKPTTPATGAKTVTFACDAGKAITATFYLTKDDHVDMKLSDGRNLSLPHALSGSGARYANADESIVFWNKGDTAFITEKDKTTFANCALPKTKQ